MNTQEYKSYLGSKGYGTRCMTEEQHLIWMYASQMIHHQNYVFKRPAVIAELGAYNGVTSALIANETKLLQEKTNFNMEYNLYTVEYDKENYDKIVKMKEEENIIGTIPVHSDDLLVVPDIIEKHGRCDLWFIDSDHRYEHVIALLNLIHFKSFQSAERTVIIIHDYKPTNGDGIGVVKAFTEWYRNYKAYYSEPSTHNSLIWVMKL